MHHLLWWEEEDAPWWQIIHPILVGGDVRAVFSGDYGPEKFSHMRRNGIDYFQSGIAPDPSLGMLLGHEWHRVSAQQFDNFLYVSVAGREVNVDVRTIGEVSSGHFTPQHWRSVYGTIRRPGPPGGRERLRALLEHPKGRWAGMAGLGLAFAGGGILGLMLGRARHHER